MALKTTAGSMTHITAQFMTRNTGFTALIRCNPIPQQSNARAGIAAFRYSLSITDPLFQYFLELIIGYASIFILFTCKNIDILRNIFLKDIL
jgi:hypothetical protein